MQASQNIMKSPAPGLLRNTGMVIAGFVAMVSGLCLGSYIADRRSEQAVVHGTRKDVVLHLAKMGPKPIRQAAMAAMADGVLTVREERRLYMVMDQVRHMEAQIRRSRESGGSSRRLGSQMI